MRAIVVTRCLYDSNIVSKQMGEVCRNNNPYVVLLLETYTILWISKQILCNSDSRLYLNITINCTSVSSIYNKNISFQLVFKRVPTRKLL